VKSFFASFFAKKEEREIQKVSKQNPNRDSSAKYKILHYYRGIINCYVNKEKQKLIFVYQ